MKTDRSSITPPNPIFKYWSSTTSFGLRFVTIILGLILLVVLLSRFTWTLGQWGQKQDLQQLATGLNTSLQQSGLPDGVVNSAFKPLTKAEFDQMEGGVHTVGDGQANANLTNRRCWID